MGNQWLRADTIRLSPSKYQHPTATPPLPSSVTSVSNLHGRLTVFCHQIVIFAFLIFNSFQLSQEFYYKFEMTKEGQQFLVSYCRVWGVGCSTNFLVLFLVPFLVVLVLHYNKESMLLRHEALLFQSKENHAASEEIHGTLFSSAKEIRGELVAPLEHNHGALPTSPSEGNHGALLVSPPKEDRAAPMNSSEGNHEAHPSSSEGKQGALLSSLRGNQGLPINSSVQNPEAILTPPVEDLSNSSVQYQGSLVSTCNMFSGTWVYDNKSLPLYKDWNCSFTHDGPACEKYGRKDLDYQHWRWQPDNCDLPKFDAKTLLEKLRDKRLVFVGDSLNRNQWVSFVCLVESSIPPALKSTHSFGNLGGFIAKEYNATIDFYWAPFLVESNADNPRNHSITSRILRIESIEKHAKHWSDADILVFNSYAWWKMTRLKVSRTSFENPNAVYEVMEAWRCYKISLMTWSNYLLKNINRKKTRLFWISASPSHFLSENWGRRDNKRCYDETQPIAKEKLGRSEVDPRMMRLIEDAIENLKARGLNIHFLNITQLSEYRKDAHPSIYRKQWRPPTKQQLANPILWSDCRHWCLPGVPDVWNQIFYSYLI